MHCAVVDTEDSVANTSLTQNTNQARCTEPVKAEGHNPIRDSSGCTAHSGTNYNPLLHAAIYNFSIFSNLRNPSETSSRPRFLIQPGDWIFDTYAVKILVD